MPCLNEEKTVGICVQRAISGLKKAKLRGEVVVCDNGSTDKSKSIAKSAGARVVSENRKGYGSAYLKGINSAKGQWIVMGDSDGTYNFLETPKLFTKLNEDYDLVIGSRLRGKIKNGSMPLLNRYLGTPFLNFFLRLLYKINVSDTQSGMRAFTKEAFEKLNLRTIGMEFASEMIIRAGQERLKIAEVPISYSRRISPTKLSRFKDAWRHIRFMLLFAPTYLFLVPGSLFMTIGLFVLMTIPFQPLWLFGKGLDFHSMMLASMLTLLGYQVIMLGIYAKTYSLVEGFEKNIFIKKTLNYFKLEKGIALGLIISSFGLLVGVITFINWANQGFGPLWAVKPAIISMTLFILGIQILFSSFFLSILGIEKN